jgi:hypothetical protein
MSQSAKGSTFTWEERQSIIEKVLHRIRDGQLPIYWREINVDDLKKAIIQNEEKKLADKNRASENPSDDAEMQNAVEKALRDEA